MQLLPVLGSDLTIFNESELRSFHLQREQPAKSDLGKPTAGSLDLGKRVEHQEEYLLRELIVLQSSNESEEDFNLRVGQMADKLTDRPDDFTDMAKELSASLIRRKGGLLTPLTLNQLEPAQQAAVQNLKIGGITPPITFSGGVIFYRREKLPQREIAHE